MRHHTLDALPQATRIFHVLRRVQHQRIKGAGCVGCVLCTVHSLYSDKWMLDFSASLRTAGARRSHSLELVLYLSTVIMMSSPHLGNTAAGLFSGVLYFTLAILQPRSGSRKMSVWICYILTMLPNISTLSHLQLMLCLNSNYYCLQDTQTQNWQPAAIHLSFGKLLGL